MRRFAIAFLNTNKGGKPFAKHFYLTKRTFIHHNKTSMNTIIITGANRGIGFECAMQMAKMAKSEQIIITSRDITSGNEAIAKIKQTTGHANISVMTYRPGFTCFHPAV